MPHLRPVPHIDDELGVLELGEQLEEEVLEAAAARGEHAVGGAVEAVGHHLVPGGPGAGAGAGAGAGGRGTVELYLVALPSLAASMTCSLLTPPCCQGARSLASTSL